MGRFIFHALLIALILFMYAGCSSTDSPTGAVDDGATEELDLESSFGGYSKTDDEIAFGDEELLAGEEDGEDALDETASDPDVMGIAADGETDVYSVRLSWGMLEGDSTNSVDRDWSGRIQLTQDGALIVERLIRFERGDLIVRPRPDRMTIDLESTTRPAWDGLLLTVFDPADMSDSLGKTFDDAELSIQLGDFETSYIVADLDSLEEVVDVDDIGNQFSISAFRVEEIGCPMGFLSGRWAKTGHERGVLRGRWTTRYGGAMGWLKGHYGVNSHGRKVFFGKYIGRGGEFRGLLRGHWGNDPGRDGVGWFRGRWHGEDDVAGAFGGIWRAKPRPGSGDEADTAEFAERRRHGFFHGRWIENCDEALDDDFDDGGDEEEL